MHAINIKKLEKVFLFGHTIIKFSIYFNRAISGKKGSSVKIKSKKIKLRKVKIIFGSHLVIRTTACFTRGLNLEYKTQEEARGLSLSREVLTTACLNRM